MADVAQVEAVLSELLDRFEAIDGDYRRALLPPVRVVELVLSDLELAYHARLDHGAFGALEPGHAPKRPDVRLSGTAEDLLAVARGELGLGDAYATGRLRVDASFVDLLRLRALL